jgi:hypothetical protein
MAKAKGTTKQVKTTVNRLKASQKPQAHRPAGQFKRGIHCQKRPASDGSDDAKSSKEEGSCARRQKKTRRVDVDKDSDEEVEEEKENEDVVEQVVDRDGDDAQSEDAEQVSQL